MARRDCCALMTTTTATSHKSSPFLFFFFFPFFSFCLFVGPPCDPSSQWCAPSSTPLNSISFFPAREIATMRGSYGFREPKTLAKSVVGGDLDRHLVQLQLHNSIKTHPIWFQDSAVGFGWENERVKRKKLDVQGVDFIINQTHHFASKALPRFEKTSTC